MRRVRELGNLCGYGSLNCGKFAARDGARLRTRGEYATYLYKLAIRGPKGIKNSCSSCYEGFKHYVEV